MEQILPNRQKRILELAVKLFEGNRDRARQWLCTPARALSGDTPLDRSLTQAGAMEVEKLILRLEHGVFS